MEACLEIERSKKVEIAPYLPTFSPIDFQQLAIDNGSIQKSTSVAPLSLANTSTPHLTPPTKVETESRKDSSSEDTSQVMLKFLQVLRNGEEITQKQALHISRTFESACQQIEKLSQDENEKWVELQEKAKTSAWWDGFCHIASMLRSAATFTLGASAVSSGSLYIGAALLTSFALGTANEVLTQTQSWDKIGHIFSSENNSSKNLSWGIRTGSEVLATLLAVPGAFSTFSNTGTLLTTFESAFSKVSSLASASAAIGSGKSKADTLIAESAHNTKNLSLDVQQKEMDRQSQELRSLPDSQSSSIQTASASLEAYEAMIEDIQTKS